MPLFSSTPSESVFRLLWNFPWRNDVSLDFRRLTLTPLLSPDEAPTLGLKIFQGPFQIWHWGLKGGKGGLVPLPTNYGNKRSVFLTNTQSSFVILIVPSNVL